MCAVNRVLMQLQDTPRSDPERQGQPLEGGQEESTGTEPTHNTQVPSAQLPHTVLERSLFLLSYVQASVSVVEVYDFLFYL